MGRRLGVLLCSLLVVTGCLQVGLATLASAASSWSVIPVSVSAYSSSLGDISCAGSSFCVATGWALGKEANALYHPLIERWNGSSWSPMQSPASELNVHLGAVSCTSPIFCMLVGYSQARNETVTPLTEQWNGKRWKIVPNAAEGMFADSISCIGSSFCAVVGTYEVAGKCSKTSVRSGTATPGLLPQLRIWDLRDSMACAASRRPAARRSDSLQSALPVTPRRSPSTGTARCGRSSPVRTGQTLLGTTVLPPSHVERP